MSGLKKNRLDDFINFWSSKNIDAIFCLRGGYGSLQLLNEIDFNLIKKHKKILLGFSDITVLLLAIYAKTKLVTFHGPMLGYKFIDSKLNPKDKSTKYNLWKLLTNPCFSFSYSIKSSSITINHGKAVGNLLGGNLTDICSMLGSNYLPDFKDSILFLEDCNEEPYKIDRMLTQLDNAGIFKVLKGILFCSFENCNFKSKKELAKLVNNIVGRYKIPTICGFPIGHGLKNYIVPIGKKVLLDTKKRILKAL